MIARELEDNVLGDAEDLGSMTTQMTEEEAMVECAEAMASLERSARRGTINPEVWDRVKRDAEMTIPPADPGDAEAAAADDALRAALQEAEDLGTV
jgi:hypothetical protein